MVDGDLWHDWNLAVPACGSLSPTDGEISRRAVADGPRPKERNCGPNGD
ncbi:hypothetical protein KHC23_18375 [Ancylobacter dichloromethanicus]|nr:hypothetical protein [Ancylobacter dichloromethanicus]MBS7555605.1 hypothetical protein [Ancylobacter dichloromethanicus]